MLPALVVALAVIGVLCALLVTRERDNAEERRSLVAQWGEERELLLNRVADPKLVQLPPRELVDGEGSYYSEDAEIDALVRGNGDAE